GLGAMVPKRSEFGHRLIECFECPVDDIVNSGICEWGCRRRGSRKPLRDLGRSFTTNRKIRNHLSQYVSQGASRLGSTVQAPEEKTLIKVLFLPPPGPGTPVSMCPFRAALS